LVKHFTNDSRLKVRKAEDSAVETETSLESLQN